MALRNLTVDFFKSPPAEQVSVAVGSLHETVERLESEHLDYTRLGAVILGESDGYSIAQALGILIGTRHTSDAISGEANTHLFSKIGDFEANVLLEPEEPVGAKLDLRGKAIVKRAGVFLQDSHRKMNIDDATPPVIKTMEGGELPNPHTTRLSGGRQYGRLHHETSPLGPHELYMLRLSTSQIIQDVLAAY